jgi:GH35 family endo-1,4-beta-xylanase
VRGHVLLWHNQLPDWLTAGVADGTISNAELRRLLHKHITDDVIHFRGKIWHRLRLRQVAAGATRADRRGRRPGAPRHAVRVPDADAAGLQRYASLGLKVEITEADVRTFVDNATDQVATDHLATFAQPTGSTR